MAKVLMPPQGGEKKLCMSLCAMSLFSVICGVLMVYFTAIIYIPGANVIHSKIQGGKKCSTLLMERELEGEEQCSIRSPTYGTIQNETKIVPNSAWWSCQEWCLSKSPGECDHVWASVRDVGTEIIWEDCDMTEGEDPMIEDEGVECNLLENEKELKCKLYPDEKGIIPADPANPVGKPEQQVDGGNKDICEQFDNNIISCEDGICTVYSNVYSCNFKSTLEDIKKGKERDEDPDPIWDGKGYCLCNECENEPQDVPFPGVCPEVNRKCVEWFAADDYPTNMSRKYCDEWVPCSNCESICSQRQKCFDMKSRKDPTLIGVNERGQATRAFYSCKEGFCNEIYDLKCERKCMVNYDEKTNTYKKQHHFNNLGKRSGKNALIFNGETVVSVRCKNVRTSTGSDIRFDEDDTGKNHLLMVSCSEIQKFRPSNRSEEYSAAEMITRDCINGTWLQQTQFEETTNYSTLVKEFSKARDIDDNREQAISFEADLMIYNQTKLQVNIDGCVNTLSDYCKTFFDKYGRDGRNYTARAIYDCFYDPSEQHLESGERIDYPTTVIEKSSIFIFEGVKDPIVYLLLFSVIPGTICVFSCIYLIVCSRMIDVGEDGHMRLKCCGKFVTGIGNVPPYAIPKRRKTDYRNPLMDGEENLN